jgi:hypothetical protein
MRLSIFLVLYLSSTVCLSVELNMLPNKNQRIERRLLQFENDNLKQSALLVIGSPNKLKSDTLIVMAHGKYDAVTPISNIEFYHQNHKQQLTAKFIYESEQHLLSADDFELAVSRDIQLIREIENGNH